MVWETPRTWIPENVITAAQLNTQIRNNLLETEAAKAVEAGCLLVSSGENQVAMRKPKEGFAASTVTTSSLTPVSLGGPSVTFTHGGTVLLLFAARMRSESGGSAISYMSCAPTIPEWDAGSINYAVRHASGENDWVRYSGHVLITGLTPGESTAELKYWRNTEAAVTAAFSNRALVAVPF